MCEHSWWLIYNKDGQSSRCGLCGAEAPVDSSMTYSVTIVEAGTEDE